MQDAILFVQWLDVNKTQHDARYNAVNNNAFLAKA